MGAEDQITLHGGSGAENRFADGFSCRHGLSELLQQMLIRFDGDAPLEGSGEGACDLAIAGAGVNEDVPGGQRIDDLLQPAFGVSLLIRMVQKDLEGSLILLAL
jgi:hypothetical protein